MFNHGSFSGPAGFNSKTAAGSEGGVVDGGKDGVLWSFSSMLSMPSGEVAKIGRRTEGLDLKREVKEVKRVLRRVVESGSARGSGAIGMGVRFLLLWWMVWVRK